MKTLLASRIGKKLRVSKYLYRIESLFVKKDSIYNGDADKAREYLMSVCPKPDGTADIRNTVYPAEYDLQIIIPVYNAHDYIERCIDSVLMQETKYTYVCYAVDDGSKDDSGKILDAYTDNPHMKIIHKPNGGLADARNTALKDMRASYVMFLDNDDYLPQGAIEALLDAAYKNDAEIVEGSVINEIGSRRITEYKKDAVTDYKSLRGQAWSKIYKSSLFETIGFPRGYWFEDTTLSFLIYPILKKVCTVSNEVYVHTLNKTGMVETVKGKPKSIETYWGTEYLDEERAKRNYPDDYDYFVKLKNQFIINHKRIFLLDDEVKKAVFTLQREILLKRFPTRQFNDEFMNYIYEGNYDMYCSYSYWN